MAAPLRARPFRASKSNATNDAGVAAASLPTREAGEGDEVRAGMHLLRVATYNVTGANGRLPRPGACQRSRAELDRAARTGEGRRRYSPRGEVRFETAAQNLNLLQSQ